MMGMRRINSVCIANARHGRRRGMSLIELLLSMTILALIMGAMTSFIFVSTRALPLTTSPVAARTQAQAFLRQISDEARSAVKVMVSPASLVASPASTYDLAIDGVVLETPDRNGDGFHDFVWVRVDQGALVRRMMLSRGAAIASDLSARTLGDWLGEHGPQFREGGALRLGGSGRAQLTIDENAPGSSVDATPDIQPDTSTDVLSGTMENLLSFARGGAMESAGGNERVLTVGPAAGDRVLVAMLPAAPVPQAAGDDDVLWRPTRASLYVRRAWVGNVIPQSCSARYTVTAWRMPMVEYLSGDFELGTDRQISRPVMVTGCTLECSGAYAVRKLDVSFTTSPLNIVSAPCTGGFPFEGVAPLMPRPEMAFSGTPDGTWLRDDECLVIEVRVPRPGDLGYASSGGQGSCLVRYADSEPAIALMANAGSGSESVVMLPDGGSGDRWQPAEAGVAFDLWGLVQRRVVQVSTSRVGDGSTARSITLRAAFEVPGFDAQRVIVTTRLGGVLVDVGGAGGTQQPEVID